MCSVKEICIAFYFSCILTNYQLIHVIDLEECTIDYQISYSKDRISGYCLSVPATVSVCCRCRSLSIQQKNTLPPIDAVNKVLFVPDCK